ncbi:hypothetical protein JL720_6791 [Aureococcus anophagefferens]|nr:hypothetical protein JL720_6791 [Aureococcus anophagefferens]
MDREPTLWERQLQKQTATGVEAALASLEKRPVVATCTTPACAGELLAAFAASRARPLAFVVVRADAFRTARELAARLAGAPAARRRGCGEAVADDGFAEIARAAPDDEAVALALREALPRKPASAPAGDVVVADAAWLRAADAASGKTCRKWLDATAATVLKRHAEDLDDAAPAASPADERTCVAERLRALARRAQRPFLRRGVGSVDRAGNGRDIPNCKGS